MQSEYLAAQDVIAMSGAVLLLICGGAGLAAWLGMWLLNRAGKSITKIDGVTVTASDAEYFAGMWVAVRNESGEIYGCGLDKAEMESRVSEVWPDVEFKSVKLPGKASGAMRWMVEVSRGGRTNGDAA